MCITFLNDCNEDDEEFGIDEATAHATGKLELRNYDECKLKLRRKELREVLIYKNYYFIYYGTIIARRIT